MRKAIASAGLAALLSMGIGTSAVAHASSGRSAQTVVETESNDDDNSGKVGLLGLVGLFGLAGFARRGGGGGKSASRGSGYTVKAPKGGHTTDWSSR